MAVKYIISGAGGQTGSSLLEILQDSIGFGRGCALNFNIEDKNSIENLFEKYRPEFFINLAALTDVERCETDPEYAERVNGTAVEQISKLCEKYGSVLIQVSTDYVFNGEKGLYKESDKPDPINEYGRSKLMGETAALSIQDSIVIRTSGVFGKKRNFPSIVKEKGEKGDGITVFPGYYSPIHCKMLSMSIKKLCEKYPWNLRIIHIAGDRISRKDFARLILKYNNIKDPGIEEKESGTIMKAKRPYDSSLSIDLAKSILDFDFHSTIVNIGCGVK
ncbi:SDR family oxidoreductase [Caldiplasma sukawensis]